MGVVRKTITLTDQQDRWVKAQISAGHYTNDSEYIRDLIRREQERNAEIEAIRNALIQARPAASHGPLRCGGLQAKDAGHAWLNIA